MIQARFFIVGLISFLGIVEADGAGW